MSERDQGGAGGARTVRSGDRIPPYSEESERALLGCILQDAPRVMELCITRQITTDSFYLQNHQTLYDTMAALHHAQRPVDVVTLSDRLRELRQLDAMGGEEELFRLMDATPTTAHADYYLQIVFENHLLRRIIDTARVVTEECFKREKEAADVLVEAEQSFFSLSEQQLGTELAWSKLVVDEMGEIETLLEQKKGLTGISSGFVDIDGKLLGFQKSDLIILAARPSMGKTSLALNFAENIALGERGQEPRPVAVFSLEMSASSLVRRMICCRAQVPGQQLARGQVGRDQHGRLMNAADVLKNAPIYVDDTAGLEAVDLRARARRLKRKYGIEFIVVDYLQLMNYSKFAAEGRQRETAAISQAMKHMAKELQIPVLVLSQLSRAPETRDSKSAVPKLSDLRDSGAIEQDADVVMLLRRPSYYQKGPAMEDERLAIVDIAKHRNGPTGEVKLDFDGACTRFSNRAHDMVDPDE